MTTRTIKRLPVALYVLWAAFYLIGGIVRPCLAQNLGGSLLRDYPSPLTVPQARLEISIDYQAAAAGSDSGSVTDSKSGAGDAQVLKLLVNYGLLRRVTLMGSLAYRYQDFGMTHLTVLSTDLSFKRNLIHHLRPWPPMLAVNAGLRLNTAAGDDRMLVDVKFEDNRIGRIVIDELRDITPYVRLTAGQIWGRVFPNLFLEYGYSDISARAETNTAGLTSGFPENLSRNEHQLRTGLSLLVKFPYKALLHLEYDYIRLFRNGRLDRINDNHIVKADFNYYLTPALVLNIGGSWSVNHLNGSIPFLYQDYTRQWFDRRCGSAQVGLTYLFGASQATR